MRVSPNMKYTKTWFSKSSAADHGTSVTNCASEYATGSYIADACSR